jgi:protein involved in polysaccharide export with SLBB domain
MLESKIFRVWFAATLLMGAISLSEGLCAQEKQDATEWVAGTYHVGIGDHLEIWVWQHSSLSKTVVVDLDGNISLPSINVVKAAGLSVNDLADLLTRKLEFAFPKPHVTVLVSRTNSYPKPPARTPPPAPELQKECCIARKGV